MPDLIQEPIKFSGNQKAVAVFSSSEDAAAEIQDKLNLAPYNAIILVFGSADNIEEKIVPRLTQLCRRGIASAAADAKAVILDGGTNAGVAMLVGAGVASRNTKVSLIGVAPKGKVSFPGLQDVPANATPLEPNHSHFVLVDGNEWGNETPTLFNLADVLMQPPKKEADAVQSANGSQTSWLSRSKKESGTNSQPGKEKKIPALAILIGGGAVTKDEVVQAVRRKIPLIVVKGSGGLAEDVTDAYDKKDVLPDDPDLAEIIADGDIHLHSLDDLVEGMNRLILRELATDKVLQQAWQTFATYDLNAGNQQSWFRHLQMWILCVGLIGTALAISDQVLQTYHVYDDLRQTVLSKVLKYLLILIPIGLTALVAASNRFKQGSKWMLLRAGAESIKREIYKYRVKGYYKEVDTTAQETRTDEEVKRQEQLMPEQELTHKVEDVTRRVMRTEVNSTSLKQYTGGVYPPNYGQPPSDDGFSVLTPDKYVEVRLDEQIKYFQGKTPKLQKQYFRLHCGVLIAAAVGTFLSAAGWPVWIALTTAVVAAFTTYLGYMQVENTLTKYNQAATDLENVKGWWNALSSSEQAMTKNIQLLVDHTEEVLQTELDGWVQQMKDALETLRKEQEKDKGKDNASEDANVPPPPPPGGEGGAAGEGPAPVADNGELNVQAGVNEDDAAKAAADAAPTQATDAAAPNVTNQTAGENAAPPSDVENDDSPADKNDDDETEDKGGRDGDVKEDKPE